MTKLRLARFLVYEGGEAINRASGLSLISLEGGNVLENGREKGAYFLRH